MTPSRCRRRRRRCDLYSYQYIITTQGQACHTNSTSRTANGKQKRLNHDSHVARSRCGEASHGIDIHTYTHTHIHTAVAPAGDYGTYGHLQYLVDVNKRQISRCTLRNTKLSLGEASTLYGGEAKNSSMILIVPLHIDKTPPRPYGLFIRQTPRVPRVRRTTLHLYTTTTISSINTNTRI